MASGGLDAGKRAAASKAIATVPANDKALGPVAGFEIPERLTEHQNGYRVPRQRIVTGVAMTVKPRVSSFAFRSTRGGSQYLSAEADRPRRSHRVLSLQQKWNPMLPNPVRENGCAI